MADDARAARHGTVSVDDRQSDEVIDADRWAGLADAVLAHERHDGDLGLHFVGVDEIAALNAEHMGHEGPTDVLSFPLDADTEDPFDTPEGMVTILGDVVVCPAVARENLTTLHAGDAPATDAPAADADADEWHAATLDDELALLVVHGVLHVLGWDHATDEERRAMRTRERELLDRYHRATP